MLEALTQYYGIDLVATVLVLLGIYFVSNKQRKGFIVGGVGNLLWIVYGIWTTSFGLILVNSVITIMYVRGYRRWGRA